MFSSRTTIKQNQDQIKVYSNDKFIHQNKDTQNWSDKKSINWKDQLDQLSAITQRIQESICLDPQQQLTNTELKQKSYQLIRISTKNLKDKCNKCNKCNKCEQKQKQIDFLNRMIENIHANNQSQKQTILFKTRNEFQQMILKYDRQNKIKLDIILEQVNKKYKSIQHIQHQFRLLCQQFDKRYQQLERIQSSQTAIQKLKEFDLSAVNQQQQQQEYRNDNMIFSEVKKQSEMLRLNSYLIDNNSQVKILIQKYNFLLKLRQSDRRDQTAQLSLIKQTQTRVKHNAFRIQSDTFYRQ